MRTFLLYLLLPFTILCARAQQYGWSNVNFVSQPNPRPDVDFLSLFFTSPQNGFASGGKNVLLKYTQTVAIGEDWYQDFMIIPNPARDNCKVQNAKCKGMDCEIDLLDLFGMKVMDVFEVIIDI